MMQDNFKIVFSLAVLHSYYENNTCTCLEFKPDAASDKLLKRFDLSIRKKRSGFELYTNTKASVSSFLNYVQQATFQDFFDFEIKTNDHAFALFTQLPADWAGQLVYSSASLSNYNENMAELEMGLSDAIKTSTIGTLRIYFNDIIKLSGPEKNAQFNMRFSARATQWQYYIINKSAVPLNDPFITGKTEIIFDGPKNVTIPTGQEALLFSSGSNLIPLSELPKYKFDLVSNTAAASHSPVKKTASKTIFKGLPNPDPRRIGITAIEGIKQLSSPMYIYI
ncbi:MAG TPA: hypothetical protein VNY73_03925 [Bacteroidia bacterium]|jgi:hypothetical protein|nr:hypothetical protein [Bacteroidia bacterium]